MVAHEPIVVDSRTAIVFSVHVRFGDQLHEIVVADGRQGVKAEMRTCFLRIAREVRTVRDVGFTSEYGLDGP